MTRGWLTLVAYTGLGLCVLTTVVIGVLYHFGDNGERYQPWVFPMCMVTFGAALVVDRLRKSRHRR